MAKTIAEQWADFAVNFQFSDIPDKIVNQAKLSIRDLLGCMFSAVDEPPVLSALNVVRSMGGVEESTIFGFGDKVPAPLAAFCNGIMCHSQELDDHIYHGRSLSHPGVVCVPPALALGEKYNIDGKLLITAVVLGYELASRVNYAVKTGYFSSKRGYHGTAICGTFGSAILAGKIMNLTPEQMVNALGIVGSLTSGSSEFKNTGAQTKKLHAGNSGKNGILAACLAKNGFTGPKTVFEGDYGFFNGFALPGNYNLDVITDNLGKEFEFSYIMYKPFACAGMLHAPLTAGLMLVQEHNIKPEDIKEVTVWVAERIMKQFCQPREVRYSPRTPMDGQLSLPYSLATVLSKHHALPADYSADAIKDPAVLNLANKIEFRVDDEITKAFPEKEPSRVRILTNDGRELFQAVEAAKGHLFNPMSAAELKDKFSIIAAKSISQKQIGEIITLCDQLENVGEMRELIQIVSN